MGKKVMPYIIDKSVDIHSYEDVVLANYLVNKLKINKFIPGVAIPIKSKSQIKNKNNILIVLAWNFYEDIKKNNSSLSNNFINIKELETNN